jgi:hypothetical protein
MLSWFVLVAALGTNHAKPFGPDMQVKPMLCQPFNYRDSMKQPEFEETIRMLEQTTGYIESLVATADPIILNTKPGPDTWSLKEILSDLRACADVWGNSIERMLKENNPTLRYVSPRSLVKKPKYALPSFDESFKEFKAQRAKLLYILKSLTHEAWQRQATFTSTTRDKHQSVYSYAKPIADHEHHHYLQLSGTIQMVARK